MEDLFKLLISIIGLVFFFALLLDSGGVAKNYTCPCTPQFYTSNPKSLKCRRCGERMVEYDGD